MKFTHKNGQFLGVGDADIYYEIQGNLNGPSLVFLHGGFEHIETFNTITDYFAKDYRLIGIDSRGHGRSTLGNTPLSYQQLQKDVSAVLSYLELDHFSLIGHSDGGITGLRLAATNAFKIDRLVTIGAHWTLKVDDPTRKIYEGVTPEAWRDMFPEECETYEQLNPKPEFVKLINALVTMWLDNSEQGYPQETVREIKVPLLVMRGDDDQLVSRENAVELANRVNGAIFSNIPFADHVAHVDQPEWVTSMVNVFLNKEFTH